MLHRLQAMLAVACLGACLSPVCGSAAKSETPPDLLLGAAEIARSAALSNFAWGLLLQLEAGDQNSTDFLAYYEKALRLAPESRVVLEHLVTPWLVERRVDKIVEVLAPVADAHPEQPHLLLVLVQALVAQGKSDEAIMRLQRVLHDVSPAEPLGRHVDLRHRRSRAGRACRATGGLDFGM